MGLRFLIDENVADALRSAAAAHNAAGGALDFLCVGDPSDLPRASADEEILRWCEPEGRILVSFDRSTLPPCLASHLASGRSSPGIFLIRPGASLVAVLESLVLVAHASEPWEWRDRVQYIPL